MSTRDDVFISGATRTPLGALMGSLSTATASELAATAISAALKRSKVSANDVDELILGCVLGAGQGQAPARQAGRKARLPDDVPAVTVNKMCGSGMKAVMLAADSIRAGSTKLIVAGGMESMSNAPFLLPKIRSGRKFGHFSTLDHMAVDGLEDAYQPGRSMGLFAEDCAIAYQFTREDQDHFAAESLRRAQKSVAAGNFKDEIAPVDLELQGEIKHIELDDRPARVKVETIPLLKPAFKPDGTVTAANSSSISDGAAAMLVMNEAHTKQLGLNHIVRIVGYTTVAQDPAWFTTAPALAIRRLLNDIEWKHSQVDAFEVNEAFAVVPMVVMRELGISHQQINLFGGACALGHPIGASGARIIVTLINIMRNLKAKRGIASLCIAGGEATAIALETVQ